ncbi:MAG TPA: EscN/YscN/HrcN family type III secretion system ATPase, partial [Myxococcaceae bacterium]|nr:EscN/YscN/HrcN family type III secretion system ATPase [Myxococcaceae bacterium]
VMSGIVSEQHRKAAAKLREVLATYEKQRDLILLGAYQRGSDSKTDEAIDRYEEITGFLAQGVDEHSPFSETLERLVSMFAR